MEGLGQRKLVTDRLPVWSLFVLMVYLLSSLISTLQTRGNFRRCQKFLHFLKYSLVVILSTLGSHPLNGFSEGDDEIP